MLTFFNCRRHWGDSQLHALLVVGLGLHVLRQVPFCFEGKVAVSTRVRPEVRVRPDVLLQHGRLLAPDAAAVADVSTPATPTDVGVVVVQALVPALNGGGGWRVGRA